MMLAFLITDKNFTDGPYDTNLNIAFVNCTSENLFVFMALSSQLLARLDI